MVKVSLFDDKKKKANFLAVDFGVPYVLISSVTQVVIHISCLGCAIYYPSCKVFSLRKLNATSFSCVHQPSKVCTQFIHFSMFQHFFRATFLVVV